MSLMGATNILVMIFKIFVEGEKKQNPILYEVSK